MPKENFYFGNQVEDDGQEPDIVVSWHKPSGLDAVGRVHINGLPTDRSGLNRLIAALRRGRNAVYGKDE